MRSLPSLIPCSWFGNLLNDKMENSEWRRRLREDAEENIRKCHEEEDAKKAKLEKSKNASDKGSTKKTRKAD